MPFVAVLLGVLAALIFGAHGMGLPDGWALGVAVVVFVPALLLIAGHAAIVKNLPLDLRLQPLEERDVSPELRAAVEEFESLGYERLGPPLLAILPLSPTVVPVVHRASGGFGVAYEVAAPRQLIMFDCVTFFDEEGQSLTSSSTPDAASLPAPVGRFFQIRDGASPRELHAFHADGLEFLARAGLRLRPMSDLSPVGMRALLAESVREYRGVLRAMPIRATVTAVWRALTKRNPHMCGVAAQRRAQEQLRVLMGAEAGAGASPSQQTALS